MDFMISISSLFSFGWDFGQCHHTIHGTYLQKMQISVFLYFTCYFLPPTTPQEVGQSWLLVSRQPPPLPQLPPSCFLNFVHCFTGRFNSNVLFPITFYTICTHVHMEIKKQTKLPVNSCGS